MCEAQGSQQFAFFQIERGRAFRLNFYLLLSITEKMIVN